MDEEVVISKMEITTQHGVIEGKTQLRIWATKVLKKYMQKGFVLDDERLKQGVPLLERIIMEVTE